MKEMTWGFGLSDMAKWLEQRRGWLSICGTVILDDFVRFRREFDGKHVMDQF